MTRKHCRKCGAPILRGILHPTGVTRFKPFCSVRCWRMWSLDRATEYAYTKILRGSLGDCWIWSGNRVPGGYGSIVVMGRYYGAHRFVYERLVGKIPSGLDLMHKCDVPYCVNPAHLTPGTRSQNIRDMFSKGRDNRPVGSRCHDSKLKAADVRLIRKMIRRGVTQLSLARKYRVNPTSINKIALNKTWKHLDA